MKTKKLTLAFVVLLMLVITLVTSQPPVPKNIKGFVYNYTGGGMENGIPVRIINNNNSEITNTEVSAPPIPQLRGAFSTSITGSTGHYITARAWNSSHYGETNATLLATTTEINITMNISRPSELNVTIIDPPDNSSYNISDKFNITINITNIGGQDSTGCEVQIQFGNSSVINVTGSDTNNLGVIGVGTTVNTSFEIQAYSTGTSNLTVNASCDSDGINFENLTSDSLQNITIVDQVPPIINLVSPANNSINSTNNNITFRFNITDGSPIENCSLIINGVENISRNNVPRGSEETFNQILSNGQYDWNINCTDSFGNVGESFTYNLTVAVFFPNVTSMSLTQGIILNAGTTTTVICNFSVEDGNGASDILVGNTTFFFVQNQSTDPDDNNVHYSNSSCTQIASSGNQANYTCGMQVQYYAVNGSWNCNATARDFQGLVRSNITNTTIDPLFAINTSTSLLDYQNAAIGQISSEVPLNITNIGNQEINITIRGYARNEGDGMAMVCPQNNITIDNERFSQASSLFATKTQLSSTAQGIGYLLPKQTQPSTLSQNSSYWQIFVPITVPSLGKGVCNGTIIFHSEPV